MCLAPIAAVVVLGGSLLALFALCAAMAGIVGGGMYITAWINVNLGSDDRGKVMFNYVYNETSAFNKLLHLPQRVPTLPYETIVFETIALLAAFLVLLILLLYGLWVIVKFATDCREEGIATAWRRESGLAFMRLLGVASLTILIPLLQAFLIGLFVGLGRADRAWRHYIASATTDPTPLSLFFAIDSQSGPLETVHQVAICLGIVSVPLFALLLCGLLLWGFLRQLRNDVTESYIDIESGRLYEEEKKL